MRRLNLFDSLTRQMSIIFLTSLVANVVHYLFHIFMSRKLGPSEYGIVASLASLLLIISIPGLTVQAAVAKYTSHFRAHRQYGKVRILLSGSIKRLSLVGIASILVFTLGSWHIASFLNISALSPVIIMGVCLFSVLILSSVMGTLQGLQKFTHLGSNMAIQSFSKLLVGILLVYAGLGAIGALFAYALSFLLGFFVGLIPLSFLFKVSTVDDYFNFSELFKYSLPVLITILCFSLLINMDVVLVKHFFTPLEAGYYSVTSIIAKTIIYLPSAIGLVMFPRTSELYSLGQETTSVLGRSLLYTSILCGGATLIYFLIPSFIVRLLFGEKYLTIVPLVGIFALAMYSFSLLNVLFMYQLSINQIKFVKILAIGTVLEAILITIFHGTLFQVILCLLAVGSFLFLANSYYVLVLGRSKASDTKSKPNL